MCLSILSPCAHADSRAASELAALRSAVEEARFTEASSLSEALLARPSLDARTRNIVLELRAIVQIAGRHEADAQHTLALLYRRDPEHPRSTRDLGPVVELAFARAQAAAAAPIDVQIAVRLERDEHGRARVRTTIAQGADSVDSVHVFVREPGEVDDAHLMASGLGPAIESAVLLPALTRGTRSVELYVEARAPSGHRLGSAGDAQAPLRLTLPELIETPAACTAKPVEPVRRKWWVWTSVSTVIAGMAIAAAVASR